MPDAPTYIRTHTDDGTKTHLTGISDYTFCGHDHAGDPKVHTGGEPEIIKDGRKHRITCSHCQELLEIAKEHLNHA